MRAVLMHMQAAFMLRLFTIRETKKWFYTEMVYLETLFYNFTQIFYLLVDFLLLIDHSDFLVSIDLSVFGNIQSRLDNPADYWMLLCGMLVTFILQTLVMLTVLLCNIYSSTLYELVPDEILTFEAESFLEYTVFMMLLTSIG